MGYFMIRPCVYDASSASGPMRPPILVKTHPHPERGASRREQGGGGRSKKKGGNFWLVLREKGR